VIRTLFTPTAPGGKAAAQVAAAPEAARPAPAPAAKAPTPAPVAAPAPAPAPAKVAAAPAPVAAPAKAPDAAPAPAAAAAAAPASTSAEVEAAVRGWASAWAGQDMDRYLAAYAADFAPGGGQSRKAWEEDRRARIVGKSSISVNLENLVIKVDGQHATAKFRQIYRADNLNISSRKTLDMQRSGNQWQIRKESVGG